MRRPLRATTAIVIAVVVSIFSYGVFAESVQLSLRLRGSQPAATAVAALWRVTGPSSGAFAYRRALAPTLDLYASAWALRLTSMYGLAIPPQVDRAALEAALRASLREPAASATLPELEALRRATIALRDLGVKPPADVIERRLERLRSGSGYAVGPDGEATPGTLLMALETRAAAGLETPGDITQHVAQALARAPNGNMSLQTIADEVIPTWQAADIALTPEERSPNLAGLRPVLEKLWQVLQETPSWDGPTLALAASALSVSRANGFETPVVGAVWASLVREDGLLELAPGSGEPDLQTTASAAELGRPLPPDLPGTMSAAANVAGWQSLAPAGPRAAVLATMVLRKLRSDDHRSALAVAADAWLHGLEREAADSDAVRERLPDVAMYNAVARATGRPMYLPPSAAMRDLGSWTAEDRHWLARAFLLSGLRPPRDVADALSDADRREPASVPDALGMLLVGRLTTEPDLLSAALAYLPTVETDGLYRHHVGVPVADLRSTAIAYAMTGRTSWEAAARFDDETGFSLIADQPASDGGSLESAFYAFGLATGFDELAAVP